MWMQRLIFEAAASIYEQVQSSWQKQGTKLALLGQVIYLAEQFLNSDKIVINPPLFNTSELRRRIIINLNMNKIVQHLWSFIKLEHTEKIIPIFDVNKKAMSTGDMNIWYTSKPCAVTEKCHISHCVFDSGWEATEAYKLEKNDNVDAWVKNDHPGFEIIYLFDGIVHKYRPDFLIRLKNGKMLVLETKGQETRRDKEKRKSLQEWITVVNEDGTFGKWFCDISYNIADIDGVILNYC